MAVAPFPIDPVLTGITLTYGNRRLIADSVLPRLPPIAKQAFKYSKWNLAEGFTIPDTRMARKTAPNEVEFSATEVTGMTKDEALDDVIPAEDYDNAGVDIDVEGRATEGLTDLVLLGREKRVADLTFASGTYGSGNKVTLSGTDQWSDYDDSDPIGDISTALDTPVIRPNVLIFGRSTWSVLARHPFIVNATSASGAANGIARRQAVADMFEVEEVLVGEGFLNTARPGLTPSYGQVWGKHMAAIYRDTMASAQGSRVTFGFTVQYGERVSGTMPEPKIGLRGSTRVRVGESVAEIIAANEVGYLIINAVA